MVELNGPIYETSIPLTEWAPLNVYLVKGTNYAALIDSGVKSMFPVLEATMARAGVADGDLRFVLHTHSHHDHIGCNAQLKARTGCLIAAHSYYANWHADFEQHYQEFARPFPHLMPDTPALRSEVLDILDAPCPLDLTVDEGTTFHLGGGVRLRAYSLPGHLMAELGWFEESTRTLILGDAVTMLEGPIFHSHVTVQGYRNSLTKIRRLLNELDVQLVVFGHFRPMRPDAVRELLNEANGYIDAVESTLIRLVASQPRMKLADLWRDLCARHERAQEFRALNMINAHLQDLKARGIVLEIEPEIYELR